MSYVNIPPIIPSLKPFVAYAFLGLNLTPTNNLNLDLNMHIPMCQDMFNLLKPSFLAL